MNCLTCVRCSKLHMLHTCLQRLVLLHYWPLPLFQHYSGSTGSYFFEDPQEAHVVDTAPPTPPRNAPAATGATTAIVLLPSQYPKGPATAAPSIPPTITGIASAAVVVLE
mmetsp:Transcript_28456/g.45757  ORF Transcript_28456/g.45757 Transcript_28456/m.45757 type:complete len:110 (+) Transcript_28456:253-582(+)